MAKVVDLDARRVPTQRDADVASARAEARAAHPSLRWVAGRAFYVAHRKEASAAACGAVGDLILAPPGVPLCVDCYPPADRETTPA